MVSAETLKNRHEGRPIVVMGGGPSVLDDIPWIPGNAIRISVNHHALYVTFADYIAFLDNPDGAKTPLFRPAIDNFKGLKISPQVDYSDYLFAGVRFWNGTSGHFATWAACFMGGDPVLLTGMDLYQGEKLYFDGTDPKAFRGSRDKSIESQINNWRSAFSKCPNPERIKAMSGPLVDVFGGYRD